MEKNSKNLNPDKDEIGQVKGFYELVQDDTGRKQAELDQQFLFEIAEKIRRAKNVENLLFAVAEAVGEHFQVRRCLFNEIDLENDRETVHRDYCRGVESVAGVHKISDYSSITTAKMQAGKTVVNRDSQTDSRTARLYEQIYAPVGERAYVAVPLLRENRWVASLWLSDDEPRKWNDAQIVLLEIIAERAWLAVEKLRSESALRESAEVMRLAMDSANMYSWQFDLATQEVVFSGNVERVVGFPLPADYDELQTFIHEEDREAVARNLRETFQNKGSYEGETRYVNPENGEIVWLQTQGSFLSDAKNEPTRFVGITQNITKRKRSELNAQFLIELETKLNRLTEPEEIEQAAIEFMGAYFDVEQCSLGHVTGERVAIVCEFRRDETGTSFIDGHRLEDYFSPQAINEFRAGLPTVVNDVKTDSRTQETAANYAALKIGAFITAPILYRGEWVGALSLVSAAPRFWRNDELALLLEVASRVYPRIERARAEENLRESETEFRQLANAVPQIVWVADAGGKIEFVNKQWIEFSGLSLEETRTPEILAGVIHPDNRTMVFDEWAKAFAGGAPYQIEARMRNHVTGEYHWFLMRSEPTRAASGNVVRWFGTSTDITFNKEAELRLRESEERFSKAFNASPLTLTISSLLTGKLVEVNETFVKATGYTREETIGKTTLELGLWKKPSEREAEMEIVRQTGRLNNAEYAFRTKTGAEIIGLLAAERIEIGGEPYALTVIQDITERKAAEEKIRESEESYRILAETASDAIIRIDENSMIQYVNTAAERIFGYAAKEMVEQPLMMLMPEELREHHRAGFGRYLKTGKRHLNWQSIEVPARHKDGRHFPLELSFGEYNRGDTRFFIGIARDITERARAQQALHESEEKFRDLANSISQFAWMADASGYIFWYNERWFEYTGTTLEEMQGWGWKAVHDPSEVERVTEKFKRHIAAGEIWEDTFPLRSRTGEFRWFLSRALPIRDAEGKIVRWFGTNTDVEELRQARLQAEQANRLKDEFLATVSHELRTPLNAILGWSNMLQSGKATEEIAARANETIYRSAKSQAQLIEDLLDVSRIITGKMKLESRPVEFAAVIEAAIDTLRPAINAKSIKLEANFGHKPCIIGGDEQRLQQIVWNLLSNAVKFTPVGGRVEVKLENDNSRARLTVSDTGKGIEAGFLPYMFERFRQEDASSTRRHGGLGLGLAIVRYLVELHGGTISATSAGENLGATFTLELPLIFAGEGQTNQTAEKSKNRRESFSHGDGKKQMPQQLTGIRILLVDDELDTLEMLDAVLKAEGANVRAAISAADGWEILQNWQPDVLVSDIAMPDEDGYSLIAKVRELAPEKGGMIPAIAMTAYVRVEDRMRVLSSGFQMYVPKPAEPSELINVIAKLVKQT
jgi:PAS domain S-box-containing protein